MVIVDKEDKWVKPKCPLIGWLVAEFAEAYTNLHMQMSHSMSTASAASFFGIRTQSADEVPEVVNIMMEDAQ